MRLQASQRCCAMGAGGSGWAEAAAAGTQAITGAVSSGFQAQSAARAAEARAAMWSNMAPWLAAGVIGLVAIYMLK